MIRKLKSGEYRLYSRKINPKTGKRRNLGTFRTRAAAEKHEREVQYFQAALKCEQACHRNDTLLDDVWRAQRRRVLKFSAEFGRVSVGATSSHQR